MSAQNKGFTLVELMVVISIIAILSIIGIVIFTGVQKNARDAKRKGDVDAISKAYEVKYAAGSYHAVADQDFASGSIPKDPTKGDYFNVLSSDGSGFKVCAALEANPADVCNTQAANCFCQISSMGTITQDSSLSGTHVELGLGGGSSPSCDPNGTLTAGLVGYWKMDEPSWNGTAGEVKDWTGSNNGTAAGGANTTPGKFSNAGNFNGSTSYVNIVNKVLFTTEFTVEAWFYKSIWKDTGVPDASAGKMEVILSKWDRLPGADVGYRFERWYGGGYFGIGVSSGVDFGVVSAKVPESSVPLNQWNHVVATFKGGQFIRLYLNGSLVAENTSGLYSQVTDAVNYPHKIGVMSHGYGQFNGLIDDVRIYNRALSPQEVTSLYNSGNGCIP